MKPIPQLNALLAFEGAARHLSFTKAAEELHITQGAISKQVNKLEHRLGIKLFHRKTRAIELTEHGTALWPQVRDAIQILQGALSRFEPASAKTPIDGCLGDQIGQSVVVLERPSSSRQSSGPRDSSEDFTRIDAS
jgi:DNA-binding transcriptional LysR family regulator